MNIFFCFTKGLFNTLLDSTNLYILSFYLNWRSYATIIRPYGKSRPMTVVPPRAFPSVSAPGPPTCTVAMHASYNIHPVNHIAQLHEIFKIALKWSVASYLFLKLLTPPTGGGGRKRGILIKLMDATRPFFGSQIHTSGQRRAEHCHTAQEWGSKNITDGRGRPVTYSQLGFLNINSGWSITHSNGLLHDWITHRCTLTAKLGHVWHKRNVTILYIWL